MCKVYTGHCGTSEIKHSLCACTVDNPRAYYHSVQAHKPCSISHLCARLSINCGRDLENHIMQDEVMGLPQKRFTSASKQEQQTRFISAYA